MTNINQFDVFVYVLYYQSTFIINYSKLMYKFWIYFIMYESCLSLALKNINICTSAVLEENSVAQNLNSLLMINSVYYSLLTGV